MPIKNDPSIIRDLIRQAVQDTSLSNREADRLLKAIKKDGVTDEEVQTVIETLKKAIAGEDSMVLKTHTKSRQKRINRFLGKLNEEHELPFQPTNQTQGNKVNWLQLMTMHNSDGPVDPTPVHHEPTPSPVHHDPTPTPVHHDPTPSPVHETPTEPITPQKLRSPSFSGKKMTIEGDTIRLGDKTIKLDGEITAATNTALWGLTRPGQLKGLSDANRHALTKSLVNLVQQSTTVPKDAPNKFKQLSAASAAAGALAEMADKLDSATIDQLLETTAKTPTPLMKSLLIRGLEKAPLSSAQKAKLNNIEKPEAFDDLLRNYDTIQNGRARAGYSTIENEAAQFALSALSFSKVQHSVDNVFKGMSAWKDLNRDFSKPWDHEELSHMNQILETYVNKYPQHAFQFGTFSKNAPKRIAEVTNQRAIKALTPGLNASKPNLKGFPLTREQADFIKTLLPNIKDSQSADNIVRSLANAEAMFSSHLPSSWGMPSMPREPMSQAAFELFKRRAIAEQDKADSTPTGKLDYKEFFGNFRNEVRELHHALRPHIDSLSDNPPTWNDVTLSPEAADYVKSQLLDHTRSVMSIDNIGRAIEIFGKANGGKLDNTNLPAFKEMLTDYKANWPEAKTFDFNKLERIAQYKVEGRDIPLCTINGETVGLAEFTNKVGMGVANAIDRSQLRHEWMADRWGYRAKQSIELLDVIAEQSVRGEGPIAILKERYPGKEITIQATGRDGAHEQFLYTVKDGGRQYVYTQGSDGTVSRYHGRRTEPILFTAQIGDDGQLNVSIPNKISTRKYPLQSTYAVGDKIDINWIDPHGKENQTEGEKFSSKSRVLEATITAYTADGKYTVQYTKPDGTEETKTVDLSEIRKANNPHFFKEHSSYFSDVMINLQTDEELKEFLDGAQPIIDRYLPKGEIINMSPTELAKHQKECVKALMRYTAERVDYPEHEGEHIDEASKRYHELVDSPYRFPLGELVKLGKGVCRHQCILEHLLLQRAGIDSRLASGAANTYTGNFRGYHIWTELNLADDARYLSDQTWDDPVIPLWDGAYDVDQRRIEMYNRTARYNYAMQMD